MLTGELLGAALAEAMKKKGVGTNELAAAFGVRPPSVTGWKKTGRIDKKHLEKLFDFFSPECGPAHWGLGEGNALAGHTHNSHIRRQRLAHLCAEVYLDNRARLQKESGLSASRLSQLLDPEHPFGKLAGQQLAERLNLPMNYFEGGELLKGISYYEAKLRANEGSAPAPSAPCDSPLDGPAPPSQSGFAGVQEPQATYQTNAEQYMTEQDLIAMVRLVRPEDRRKAAAAIDTLLAAHQAELAQVRAKLGAAEPESNRPFAGRHRSGGG